MSLGNPLTYGEVRAHVTQQLPALVDPYLPLEGVTLLHGTKGVGKSPLGWLLAHCVATGTPFFGYAVQPRKVLTVEVDTPEPVVIPRLKTLTLPAIDTWVIYFSRPFNIRNPLDKIRQELTTYAKSFQPGLVIINTLRKVFEAPEKDPEIASSVYIALQQVFPGTSIVTVHHDRKQLQDESRPSQQAFSGSRVWADDAQSVIHLTKQGTENDEYILVEHTGCQYAAPANPLSLILDLDGSNLTMRQDTKREKIETCLAGLPTTLTKREAVKQASQILGKGYSERTIWSLLQKGLAASCSNFSPEKSHT